MNILIVGNGFDLAHGLSTRYIDFLEFIKCVKHCDLINEMKKRPHPSEKLIIKDDYKNVMHLKYDDDRSQQIFEVYNLIRDNIWIEHFLSKQQQENKGWIDFEQEISKIIQDLDYMRRYHKKDSFNPDYRECITKLNQEKKIFGQIDKTLREDNIDDDTYKLKIIDRLNMDLDSLIRCLEIYLADWVNQVPIRLVSPDIQSINVDKLLSFNYTSTFKRIYNCKCEQDFIHGQAKAHSHMYDNNMVLGIDEYLDDDRKNKDIEFIGFKKYFQRIYKKTGCKYKEWIQIMSTENKEEYDRFIRIVKHKDEEFIKEHCNEHNLYIFGHSLDITDKDILKELILLEYMRTTIFYFDEKSYAQQISNLVKVIGQDELIKRVSEPNKTIIFKQQRDMIPTV